MMRLLCTINRHRGHKRLVWHGLRTYGSGGYLVRCDRCGILRDLWLVTTNGATWAS
jgi:hypothetical protein